MEYKIIKFYEDTGQVVLRIDDGSKYGDVTVDLPIDANNRVPEGQELDDFLQGFVPTAVEERLIKIQKNGIANPTAIVVDPIAEQIDLEETTNSARTTRNDMLTASDWTQLSDAPISENEKTLWAEYRQLLRDVPSQAGFPTSINWPVSPDTNLA